MTDKPRVREGDPEARLSYFDVAQLVGTNMPEPPLHRVAQSDVEAAYYICGKCGEEDDAAWRLVRRAANR